MFDGLFDFGMKRNWRQAIGFYLFYVLVFIIIGMIYGGLFFSVPEVHGFHEAFEISRQKAHSDYILRFLKFIMPFVLSVFVLKEKKLYRNPMAVLLVLVAMALSILGAIFTMVPIAVLTTRESGQG